MMLASCECQLIDMPIALRLRVVYAFGDDVMDLSYKRGGGE
jgi:hypothetical protein